VGYDVRQKAGAWVTAQGARRRKWMLASGAVYGTVTLTSLILAFTRQLSLLESALLLIAVFAIRPFAHSYIDRHLLLTDGAAAEVAVGETLNELRHEGWIVMHDIERVGRANIDHLVCGPSGVFLIETKLRRYDDRHLSRVMNQALVLHKDVDAFVQPVIALHRRAKPKCFKHKGVFVVPHQLLLAWLREQHNKPVDFDCLARWADSL